MDYLRKLHMLCINKVEFEKIYKQAKQADLLRAMLNMGLTMGDLQDSPEKMQEVVNSVHAEVKNDKEEIELFVALFGHLGMYPDGSSVCLVLKDDIDPRKTPIGTLDKLKSSIKEGSITDFSIETEGELRQFQLKQYKDFLDTDHLFAFIEKKINHYGKDLGSTNLLVVLQSDKGSFDDVNFEELNSRIKAIGITSDIEVLISYNENNKYDVINVVYPELGTCRKERPETFTWHSEGRE